MALQTSFPGPSGVVDSVMLRKDLLGLVAAQGVFPGAGPLLSSQASLNVAVASFSAAIYRAGGVIFIRNDGAVNVPIGVAPVANSRIDVVYVMQHENGYGGLADGDNLPVFGVVAGDAAPSPVPKPVPSGALELGTVQIPAGATSTASAGVVISTTAATAALNYSKPIVDGVADTSSVGGVPASVYEVPGSTKTIDFGATPRTCLFHFGGMLQINSNVAMQLQFIIDDVQTSAGTVIATGGNVPNTAWGATGSQIVTLTGRHTMKLRTYTTIAGNAAIKSGYWNVIAF